MDLATGKLEATQYEVLAGVLDKRLRQLEAEVHARLQQQARACGIASKWRPAGPAGS